MCRTPHQIAALHEAVEDCADVNSRTLRPRSPAAFSSFKNFRSPRVRTINFIPDSFPRDIPHFLPEAGAAGLVGHGRRVTNDDHRNRGISRRRPRAGSARPRPDGRRRQASVGSRQSSGHSRFSLEVVKQTIGETHLRIAEAQENPAGVTNNTNVLVPFYGRRHLP
jgi:hypothetical protein